MQLAFKIAIGFAVLALLTFVSIFIVAPVNIFDVWWGDAVDTQGILWMITCALGAGAVISTLVGLFERHNQKIPFHHDRRGGKDAAWDGIQAV